MLHVEHLTMTFVHCFSTTTCPGYVRGHRPFGQHGPAAAPGARGGQLQRNKRVQVGTGFPDLSSRWIMKLH